MTWEIDFCSQTVELLCFTIRLEFVKEWVAMCQKLFTFVDTSHRSWFSLPKDRNFFSQNFENSEFNLKTDGKWILLLNDYYKTVSDHFFWVCMFIFYKSEVQMVILICSTNPNPNLFKIANISISAFLQFCKKKLNCVFCVSDFCTN